MLTRHRGKWSCRTADGRRFSTGLPAERRYREAAERKAREIERALGAPQGTTVADIMAAYLRDLDQRAVDKERPRWAWKQLADFFGPLTPNQIGRLTCRDYIRQRRRAGRADGTIIKELNTLRAGLRWHDKNTPAIIEMPPAPAPRDRHLTRDQFAGLLAATTAAHLKVFLHLAIATAGRKEAILQMTWPQVRWDPNEIWLGVKPSGKKRATVPMTKTLRRVLERAREQNVSGYLVEWHGRPCADVKKGFAAAVAAAGLEDVTPHDLRHTAAVWMAGAGVPMSKISQYLGHSSTSVTERIYARYQPDHLRDAADALEL